MGVGREIIASREASSVVITWTEYICLSVGHDGRAQVENCQYDVS
jgi:hypothetical protein